MQEHISISLLVLDVFFWKFLFTKSKIYLNILICIALMVHALFDSDEITAFPFKKQVSLDFKASLFIYYALYLS